MLVEVLGGLVVFGVIVAAMVPLMVTMTRAVNQARHVTTATNYAQDKLEAIRVMPYANIASGSDSVTAANVTYARTWTVSTGPSDTSKAVTVAWADPVTHQVKFDTVVAQ